MPHLECVPYPLKLIVNPIVKKVRVITHEKGKVLILPEVWYPKGYTFIGPTSRIIARCFIDTAFPNAYLDRVGTKVKVSSGGGDVCHILKVKGSSIVVL